MARALLVIDVQNDFIPPGGALPVPAGGDVVTPINALMAGGDFDLVVATRDWHPADHSSFEAEGGPWPPHCVRGTIGAELSPTLGRTPIDAVVDTGVGRDDAGYSAFERSELDGLLDASGVDDVTVVGLATDYCVRHTALDALRRGMQVTVLTDAVRGIDPGDSERTLEELRKGGATVR